MKIQRLILLLLLASAAWPEKSYFIQMSDPQFGMYSANRDFAEFLAGRMFSRRAGFTLDRVRRCAGDDARHATFGQARVDIKTNTVGIHASYHRDTQPAATRGRW